MVVGNQVCHRMSACASPAIIWVPAPLRISIQAISRIHLSKRVFSINKLLQTSGRISGPYKKLSDPPKKTRPKGVQTRTRASEKILYYTSSTVQKRTIPSQNSETDFGRSDFGRRAVSVVDGDC